MDNTEPPRSKNSEAGKNKNGTNKKEYLKKRAQKRGYYSVCFVFLHNAVLSLGSDIVVSTMDIFIAIPVLLFFIITVLFLTRSGLRSPLRYQAL
jgi:magnesium-transporting ATPase (P-type)